MYPPYWTPSKEGTYHMWRLFLFAFKQYLNDITNKYSKSENFHNTHK